MGFFRELMVSSDAEDIIYRTCYIVEWNKNHEKRKILEVKIIVFNI